jgi:hypothetical protein
VVLFETWGCVIILLWAATFVTRGGDDEENHETVPERFHDRLLPSSKVCVFRGSAIERLVVPPFKFGPRRSDSEDENVDEVGEEEKDEHESRKKKKKSRQFSKAERCRFYVPTFVLNQLLERFSLSVCLHVFGLRIDLDKLHL